MEVIIIIIPIFIIVITIFIIIFISWAGSWVLTLHEYGPTVMGKYFYSCLTEAPLVG